jgi:hypothetical protein
MGPLSSTQQSPSLNLTQSRVDSTNPQFRENQAARERLDLTKPSGTSAARSQKPETRDYQNTEKLATNDTRSEDTRSTSGSSKRGVVLDISV